MTKEQKIKITTITTQLKLKKKKNNYANTTLIYLCTYIHTYVDMYVLFLHVYMFMHMLLRISERLIVGIIYSLKKKKNTYTISYTYTAATTNICYPVVCMYLAFLHRNNIHRRAYTVDCYWVSVCVC